MSGARVAVTLAVRAGAAPPWAPGATCAVAVDVLRATTTLSVALAHGAAAVVPLAGPAEALARRGAGPGVLACGERGGRIVPGFDLGNSPAEYAPAVVGGRTLAFASTNGSRALLAAAGCARRVLGAFVNAAAVRAAVAREPRVWIACAGKEGAFALEDAAFAGWLVRALAADGARPEGAAARFAATLAPAGAEAVRALVEGSAHGRDLAALGPEYRRDVAFCATLDSLDRAFGW